MNTPNLLAALASLDTIIQSHEHDLLNAKTAAKALQNIAADLGGKAEAVDFTDRPHTSVLYVEALLFRALITQAQEGPLHVHGTAPG